MKGNEIIELILNDLGVKAPTFAKSIGVLYQRVLDIQNGRVKKISYDLAKKIIEKYPQYNESWLLSGEGSPYSEEVAEAKPQGIPLVPVSAMAGALTGELPAVTERECERYTVPKFERADFLITVAGDSMFPKFHSGDIVACRRVPLGSAQVVRSFPTSARQRGYSDCSGVRVPFIEKGRRKPPPRHSYRFRSASHPARKSPISRMRRAMAVTSVPYRSGTRTSCRAFGSSASKSISTPLSVSVQRYQPGRPSSMATSYLFSLLFMPQI